MAEMSNLKLAAQIGGGIAIACLMSFLVLALVYLIIPETYPDTKLYIGLVVLISLNVAVVLGYVRYQRLRSFKSSEHRKSDSLKNQAKRRAF